MHCHKSREEMHPGSWIGVAGLVLLCGPPATAVESQRERVAVGHSATLAGPSEAWWSIGYEVIKVLPLPMSLRDATGPRPGELL